MLHREVLTHFVLIGVDEQNRGARVVDDVPNLLCVEPKVDGHKHPPVLRSSPERDEEPSRVGRHHGHAVTDLDSEVFKTASKIANPFTEACVGERAEGPRRAWLVDDSRSIGVHEDRAVEIVADGELDLHGLLLLGTSDGAQIWAIGDDLSAKRPPVTVSPGRLCSPIVR